MKINISKELLQKYFDGRCTDEETEMVENYLSGDDTSLFDEYFRGHLNDSQPADPAVDKVFRQERKKIFRLLTPVTSIPAVRWLAAASVLVVLAVGGTRLWRSSGVGEPTETRLAGAEWVKVSNDEAASIKKVRLPDGTTIHLNVHAYVRYDRNSF